MEVTNGFAAEEHKKQAQNEASGNYCLDMLSFFGAVLFVAVLCIIIYNLPQGFMHPGKSAEMNVWNYMDPNIRERTSFILSVLLFPCLFVFFRAIGEVFRKNISMNYGVAAQLISVFATTGLIILAAADFSINFRDSTPPYNYIMGMLAEENLIFNVILAFLLGIVIFIFRAEKVKAVTDKGFLKRKYLLFELLLLFVIIIVSFDNLPEVKDNYHFDAVFYSAAQVYNGQSILVDLTTQYGLYAHFTEPLLKAMGGLTVWNFKFLMSVLIFLSFCFLYLFMKNVIKNRIILFFAFIALMFYAYVNFYLDYRGREYYQYFPIRVIFPAVVLFLASMYFRAKSLIIYYLLPVFIAVGILWNPDTGIICALSWFLVMGFSEIQDGIRMKKTKKEILRKLLFHFLNILEIITVVFIFFSIYIFFRSGVFPDYGDLMKYQKIYYQMGFGSMPMQLIHPWNLVILAFMLGLVKSLGSFFWQGLAGESIFRSRILFLLSVLGTGLFAYYQGRSHDWALVPLLYLPLIIAAIILEDAVNGFVSGKNSGKRVLVGNAVIILFLLFVFTSPSEKVFDRVAAFKFKNFAEKFHKKYKKSEFMHLADYFSPGEEVYVISAGSQSIIYADTGTVNPVNVPGQSEITVASDMEKVKNYFLEEGEGRKMVWDRTDGGAYVNHYKINFKEKYSIEAVFPGSQVEIYKQYSFIPEQELFFESNNKIAHYKRYNRGVHTKIDKKGNFVRNFHSDSGEKIKIDSFFNLEMLISVNKNEISDAVIFGNFNENRGFELMAGEDDKYFFAAGTGSEKVFSPEFALEPEKKYYIAVNYMNGKWEIFVNGEKTAEFEAEIKASNQNFKLPHKWSGFKGEIYELMVSEKLKTDKEILETAKKIWTKNRN